MTTAEKLITLHCLRQIDIDRLRMYSPDIEWPESLTLENVSEATDILERAELAWILEEELYSFRHSGTANDWPCETDHWSHREAVSRRRRDACPSQ